MSCESLWLRPLRGSSRRVPLHCFKDYEYFFESFEQYGYKLPDKITVKWRPIGQVLKQVSFEDEQDKNLEFIKELAVRIRSGESVPPVLLNEYGKIFDGRHRAVAANMLGIKNVPVTLISESPVRKRPTSRFIPQVPKETAWDIIMRGKK